MIGIFILIAAYRYYARLAEKFGKTKWQYGLLAIGVYLGTQIILGLSYGAYIASTDPESLENVNYTGFSGINLLSWLLSLAAVWGVYKFLENKLIKERPAKSVIEIEEIGRTTDQ